MTTRALVSLVIAAALGACFDPHYDAPMCGPGGECPAGYHCAGDTCVMGEDAGGSTIDGPAPDADSRGCYVETHDATNQTTAEQTARTIPADGLTICGQFDDKPPGGNMLMDVDVYALTSTGGPIGIRVDAPGADAFDLGAIISPTGLTAATPNTGWFAGSRGFVVAPSNAAAFNVAVASRGTAMIGHPVPYTISFEAVDPIARCTPGAASVTEVLDTDANMHKGNDVLTLPGMPLAAPGTTTAATDAPEMGVSFDAMGTAVLAGTASFANTGAGDTYLDRDTFAIPPVSSARDLDIVLGYTATGSDDLDLYLVRQSDLRQQYVGFSVGPEASSVALEPGVSYLLTVAHYQGGSGANTPYTVKLCQQTPP